jgi:predicted transposase YdaD
VLHPNPSCGGFHIHQIGSEVPTSSFLLNYLSVQRRGLFRHLKEGGREGGKEGGRKEGREGGKEGGRKEGREGGGSLVS